MDPDRSATWLDTVDQGCSARIREVASCGAQFVSRSRSRVTESGPAGLGEPWCRDGGAPQECLLSMVFIVALYVPWCRHLESLLDVQLQFYASIFQ